MGGSKLWRTLCATLVVAISLSVGVAGAAARGPAARACLGSALPHPHAPVLTRAQAVAALHQSVTYVRGRVGAAASCQWNGRRLPAARITPYRRYTVQLWLSVRAPFRSVSAAKAAYGLVVDAFGIASRAHGIGSEAAFIHGQDQITSQLLVRAGVYVFEVSLDSPRTQARQRADLRAVADDVLVRLGQRRAAAALVDSTVPRWA